MVAVHNPAVASIVLMAGPGVPGDDILVSQARLNSQAAGMSREQADKNASDLRQVLAVVKQGDATTLEARLREALAAKVPPAQVDAQVRALSSPWLRYFVAYDPAAALKRVSCPVLAVTGEKDWQVAPAENLAAIRTALQAGGNTRIDIEQLPGLNHLFQTAKTGAPSEYGEIEETMSPVVMTRIAAWISKLGSGS
jgi:uncharacterized protein